MLQTTRTSGSTPTSYHWWVSNNAANTDYTDLGTTTASHTIYTLDQNNIVYNSNQPPRIHFKVFANYDVVATHFQSDPVERDLLLAEVKGTNGAYVDCPVVITTPPVIDSALPATLNPALGAIVTQLQVSAHGGGALTYKWKKIASGVTTDLTSTANKYTFTVSSNASSAVAADGLYVVTVTNRLNQFATSQTDLVVSRTSMWASTTKRPMGNYENDSTTTTHNCKDDPSNNFATNEEKYAHVIVGSEANSGYSNSSYFFRHRCGYGTAPAADLRDAPTGHRLDLDTGNSYPDNFQCAVGKALVYYGTTGDANYSRSNVYVRCQTLVGVDSTSTQLAQLDYHEQFYYCPASTVACGLSITKTTGSHIIFKPSYRCCSIK
ncbi:MAG: hypothetical protein A2Z20_08605 [Bdellovibrionales bacterium RBG_16_40_8]|nr:MAG: hypothetical protein A2Z20_08605 [Bdellovibrionales bacterium RBG_16_40_8]